MRNSNTRNKIFNISYLSAAGATVLLCFIIYPLYLMLVSDAAFQGKLYTAALYYLSSILGDLIFAVIVALTAAGSFIYYTDKAKLFRAMLAVYLLDLSKYIFNILATVIFDGAAVIEDTDFYYSFLLFALDAIIITSAMLCSMHADKLHLQRCKTLNKAYMSVEGREYNELEDFFPFKKLVSPKTVVETGLFHGMVLSALFEVLSSVYYDIFMGLPTSAEQISALIQNYLGIAITAVFMYALAYYLTVLMLRRLPEYKK